MKIYIPIVFLLSLLPSMSFAGEGHQHEDHGMVSGVGALSPKLRGLLSKEMQALQSGMMSIIPAYISGNWNAIEITAGKMNNSHILKQSLTDEQIEELHVVLPDEFLEMDKRFHYLAGMLEHAAKHKKSELINFYFSEMNEACAGCHAAFATHRFPAFVPEDAGEEDGHAH